MSVGKKSLSLPLNSWGASRELGCSHGRLNGAPWRSEKIFLGRWRCRGCLHLLMYRRSSRHYFTSRALLLRALLSLDATLPSLARALSLSTLLLLSLLVLLGLLLLEGCQASSASDASTIATHRSLAARRGCAREDASATSAWSAASDSRGLQMRNNLN